MGLPIKLFGALHRVEMEDSSQIYSQGEFGDSPRDRVLAQLEVHPLQMQSTASPLRSHAQNTMQGNGRKKRNNQRMKKRASSKPASSQCAYNAQDQDRSDTSGDQAAPSANHNMDATRTNATCDSKASAHNEANSSTPAEVNAVWPENATTLMLRNIPNRYTPEELLAEMIAVGFDNTFNFFYLPIDFSTKRNRGYGFINFRDTESVKKFVEAFHQQRLQRYSTQKILEVSPALTQGFDANVSQYVRKDAQRIQNPWFRPMIFFFKEEDTAVAHVPEQT